MNNKCIYTDIINRGLAAIGCKAKTEKGRARAAVKNRARVLASGKLKPITYRRACLDRLPVGSPYNMVRGAVGFESYSFFALEDFSIGVVAAEKLGKMGQKKNCSIGGARIDGESYQCRWEEIKYRGRWSGKTGAHLYWDYQSCIGLSRSGRSVVIIQENVLKRRIIAPKGMLWASDEHGVKLVRQSDKMDYHPALEDFRAKDFVSRVRRKMAGNYKRRMAGRKEARQKHKTFKQLRKCHVSLNDSLQSGNCLAGSLRVAGNLGLNPRELVDMPWMGVSAWKLDFGDARQLAAAEKAYQRETLVSI